MTEQHFLYLLDGFKRQRLSREELILFLDAADELRFESLVGDQLIKDIAGYRSSFSGDPAYQQKIWESLNRKRSFSPVHLSPPVRRLPFLRRWWAAASVLLVIGIGAWFWSVHKKNTVLASVAATTVDIAPGSEGAVLTLADGSQVVLDSLGNGVIARQNGAQVVMQDGGLVYDVTGEAAGDMVYNTMSTPKGRQFGLLLPDGTKVWLNAASSIRYPTVFSGKERKVEVSGEAYFEVAKHTQLPFRLNVNDKAEIEVLGTSFNVNAYEDEANINATLLEGSVRVLVGQQAEVRMEAILKPGQQAQIMNADGSQSEDTTTKGLVDQKAQPAITVLNADMEKVMAWKNGLFYFEGANLEELMRQLERWYDIKVVYEKDIPKTRFFGEIARDIPLSELLDALKKSEVRFRMEGRRLIVLP